MAVEHYENFPVASLLLPRRLRPAVEAVYAFARSADDLADEGDAAPAERLAALASYGQALERIAAGQSGNDGALFANLAREVRNHSLPLQPLHDLLSAFRQDVGTTRYPNFALLMDYCARSANPVGAVMLHLYGAADPASLGESDAICSALQLTNFLQDVALDWEKGRIYLPLEDMARFGVDETAIAALSAAAAPSPPSPTAAKDAHPTAAAGGMPPAWGALMAFQVGRTRALMLSGAPLALRLPGRIGWELRLVVQGGLRILERIERADYDVFRRRPILGPRDWLKIVWRALWMRA